MGESERATGGHNQEEGPHQDHASALVLNLLPLGLREMFIV